MVRTGNFEETKERARQYIKNGDYSVPFVIAGWTGIGKSAMIAQLREEFSVQVNDIAHYSLFLDFDKAIAEGNSKKIHNLSVDAIESIDNLNSNPSFVEITIGLYESAIRPLLRHGIPINILRLDEQEWFDWANGNVEPGVLFFAKKMGAHSGVGQLKQLLQILSQTKDNIVNFDFANGDSGELSQLLHQYYKLMSNMFVSIDEFDEHMEDIMNTLIEKQAEMSQDNQVAVMSFLMQTMNGRDELFF